MQAFNTQAGIQKQQTHIQHVQNNLQEFIQFKAEMARTGSTNKAMIQEKQAHLVQLLNGLIVNFEAMQNERVVSASGFQIETLRTQLVSLQAQYSAAAADIPKLEGQWKVKEETMQRSYDQRVAEFNRQKDADDESLNSRRHAHSLQITQHQDLEGQRRTEEYNRLHQGQEQINLERTTRLQSAVDAHAKRILVLQNDRSTKLGQLDGMRTQIEKQRYDFDLQMDEQDRQYKLKHGQSKDGITSGFSEWERGINDSIANHGKDINGQITTLEAAYHKHHQDFQANCETELRTLIQQKNDLALQIQKDRDSLAQTRQQWLLTRQHEEDQVNIYLNEERSKINIDIGGNARYLSLEKEISSQGLRINELTNSVYSLQTTLSDEKNNLEMRKNEYAMQAKQRILNEESQIDANFHSFSTQISDSLSKLQADKNNSIYKLTEEQNNLVLLWDELKRLQGSWEATKEFIKSTVAEWTPVYELNVRGDHITLPQKLIHRVPGSQMDKYFSQANRHSQHVVDGKIFLERDPRIFRLVIKFIRCWGDPNVFEVDSLPANDRSLFLIELKHWGIDQQSLIKSKTFVGQYQNQPITHQKTQVILNNYNPVTPTKLQSHNTFGAGLNLTPLPDITTFNAGGLQGGPTITSFNGLQGGRIAPKTVTPSRIATTKFTSTSSLEAAAVKGVVESIWSSYDTDNNGALDIAEATRFIKSALGALSDTEGVRAGQVKDSSIMQAFNSMDVDHNGTIDKAEMVQVMSKLLNGGQL